MQIDEIDAKILRAIQRDANLTFEQLAQQIALSPSAVQRRLTRLRKEKIIEATVSLINPRVADLKFAAIVSLQMEVCRKADIDAFMTWIADKEEIQFCWYVSGEPDLLFFIQCRDVDRFQEIMNDMREVHTAIVKYRTMVVMRSLKRSHAIPCEVFNR